MKKVITGLTSFIAFDMVCGMINLYDSNANNNQIIRRDEINNIAKKK